MTGPSNTKRSPRASKPRRSSEPPSAEVSGVVERTVEAPVPTTPSVVSVGADDLCLLGYLDSLYATAATFSFGLAVNREWAAIGDGQGVSTGRLLGVLGPAAVATLFLFDDWFSARPIAQRYGYRNESFAARLRLVCDALIVVTSFVLISLANRPLVYLFLFGVICALGKAWATLLRHELRVQGREDPDVDVICETHGVMALVPLVTGGICWLILGVVEPRSSGSINALLRYVGVGEVMLIFGIYKWSAWRNFGKKASS